MEEWAFEHMHEYEGDIRPGEIAEFFARYRAGNVPAEGGYPKHHKSRVSVEGTELTFHAVYWTGWDDKNSDILVFIGEE